MIFLNRALVAVLTGAHICVQAYIDSRGNNPSLLPSARAALAEALNCRHAMLTQTIRWVRVLQFEPWVRAFVCHAKTNRSGYYNSHAVVEHHFSNRRMTEAQC
jgi:hypothetical protein